MSTAFRVRPELPWDYLFANLPEGIKEEIVPASDHSNGTTDKQRCLTNGQGYLWAYTGDGSDTSFERYGLNHQAAEEILDVLADKFNVRVVSEYDDDFFSADETVESDLEDYAEEWAVHVAEEGEEQARQQFMALIERARAVGLQTAATYPDGQPLPIEAQPGLD
jgi:hypothetical protein